ncbi:MAG: sugar phosphate isomerase/epimerase [Atopobiaceae bacterium]|jgi:sugar phosphate isomerase/epimerase|nr:sugar phosphate isomerase/epimerase [Atopobiaceae bacterium]MCH4180500.1 sugar phosphate isomerase/epimerase [Atopobiaceae bacterium]MCH4214194.1 sugar phosphate isomerase/epimerase [Atopobiaceae bacterium]MCH4229461.1 sugar phosphate isomerase/epimerase [Atopobiaceae bacterium]MCH4275860.1 sugar phosphate isomerase/epimerase [Atopobiaceae bacterium]
MSNIKLGITLFCYTRQWCTGEFDLEDCIRHAKEAGAEGFEIVATQMIPSYPYVSDKFLGEITAMCRHYDIEPVCYSANMDRGLRGDRNLTEDEMLAMAINDVIQANKMGCKVMREQYLLSADALARLAPYAEEYNVKVGIEIHNPETPYTPAILAYREAIEKSGSHYIGFVPDFGLFATKPNKPAWDEALAAGTPVEQLEEAKQMRLDGVSLEEANDRLVKEGANAACLSALQGMYGFVQFRKDCNKELEGLKEIMPYCFHMHGKFHYMYEDLHEASIPYEQILPVVADSDYEGYIVSECENHTAPDTVEQVRRHLAMMRKYLNK